MRTWHYDRGKWTEIPSLFDLDADLIEELEALAFEERSILLLGDSDEFGVQVYAHDEAGVDIDGPGGGGVQAEFLACVNTGAKNDSVFVADLPSPVQFIGQHRPLFVSDLKGTS